MGKEEDIARSEELKAQANAHFAKKEHSQALELYTQAIELNPTNHVLYSNRSACHLIEEAYGSAITDAAKSIELSNDYAKGHYRRGCAYISLCKYKDALRDFKAVCQLAPKDKAARKRYNECAKLVRKEAFEKAIQCDNLKPPSEVIDLTTMDVSDKYDGLRLPETVTMEWVQSLMEFYREQKKLPLRDVYDILLRIKALLVETESLVDLAVPEGGVVTVFGDVHGQLYDVLNMLSLAGLPSETNMLLFNGDLVDRGSWSVEVILLAFCMKLAFPRHVHIARGNHETKSMNKVYGFEGEVKAKYTDQCFEFFLEIFCYLPLAHLIGGKVFVCHGGLFSEDNIMLEDIRKVKRNREPPETGVMCELLWSDPLPGQALGREPSKRGVGVGFGKDVTKNFLERNGLDLVVRSHEVRMGGYSQEHDNMLVTIFSAPNYCDREGNKGAFIKFGSDLKPQFTQFAHVPHPDLKPMAYANTGMFGL